ncbi:MAG: hypothetical protein FJ291_21675 [Planctomycetes bacterium]|nr:hypothetical protein [Planctomycetota bacterium]
MPENAHVPHEPAKQPRRRSLRRVRLAPIVAASVLAGVALIALVALWVAGESLTGLLFGRGLDAEAIEVDAAAFKEYFTVERKLAGDGGRTLILTLKRTKAFPVKDSDFETLAEKAPRAYPALLPIETLARNYYVRCQYFTKKNEYLGFTLEWIRGLVDRETIELSLPVAGRRGLRRIVITY